MRCGTGNVPSRALNPHLEVAPSSGVLVDKSVLGSESEPTIMKRNMKRLALNRETLRYLNAEEMSAVQGGASERLCPAPSVFVVCVSQSCPSECGQWYCYGV
jgi:hypothetical protein